MVDAVQMHEARNARRYGISGSSRDKWRIPLNVALAGWATATLLTVGTALFIWSKISVLEQRSEDLARTVLLLERSIGYDGFIHNFKNAVLRPDEPRYVVAARGDFDSALQMLDTLDAAIDGANASADLAPIRATLIAYKDNLEAVVAAHERGEAIADIDALVRIPDDEASFNLELVHNDIEAVFEQRREVLIVWQGACLMVLFLLMSGMVGSTYVTSRTRKQQLRMEQSYRQRLETLIHQLERSNRDLDEFAYIASHDLKEPLRGIAINGKFLLREELGDKARERVERMTDLCVRMEALISDLLMFSRLNRAEASAEVIDVAEKIRRIEGDLREFLDAQNGKIVIEGALPLIRAERAKIKTIFQNLIINGLKYNRSDTKTVEIGFLSRVDVHGHRLDNVFYVRDNGIGIEDKNREKIYRIFSRLNRDQDFGRGTGAGLAFVKKIVEEYGSTISFSSQPGKGTTFYFALPLV